MGPAPRYAATNISRTNPNIRLRNVKLLTVIIDRRSTIDAKFRGYLGQEEEKA